MEKDGKYIYCIISSQYERNFGPIGIGGRSDEVLTISCDDLSMVVSSCPIQKFVVNKEDVMAHEKVIEEVMKEYDSVLPVRFGTIAANADSVRDLLERRYKEFKNLLTDVEHKVELSVKGLWEDMDIIFKEILKDNKKINTEKEKIQNDLNQGTVHAKNKVGKMVKEALQNKKDLEVEKILLPLRKASKDYKLKESARDEVLMDSAFLVDRGREKEFDNIMDDLSEAYKGRIKFMYSGPFPVFNFVNIVIYQEEWQK